MDKKILIEYCELIVEIKELRRQISDIEDKLRKIKKGGPVGDVVKGGLGGIQHFKINGFPDSEHRRTCELLKRRKDRLKLKEIELLELTNQAEEFIESIEKSELRTMFRLYYIEGLTWPQVAMSMNSLFPKRKKAYTEESCKKRNQRFFEKI